MNAGLYPDMLEWVYRESKGISHSDLKAWCGQGPRGTSRKLYIGKAVHTMLLEPELAKDQFVTMEDEVDLRSNEGAALAREMAEEHPGKIVLKPSERSLIKGCVTAVQQNSDMTRILRAKGERELCMFGELEPGLLSKGMADLVLENSMWDVKTTYCGSMDDFEQSIYKFGYDSQAAYYSDLYASLTGKSLHFGWLCISTSTLNTWIYKADEHHLLPGRRWYKTVLPLYAKGNFLPKEVAG